MKAEKQLQILVIISTVISVALMLLCGHAARYLFTLRVSSVYLHYLLIVASFIPAILCAGFVVALYFLARLWLELKEPTQ